MQKIREHVKPLTLNLAYIDLCTLLLLGGLHMLNWNEGHAFVFQTKDLTEGMSTQQWTTNNVRI